MIRSVTLENYRGLRHFALHDLGRVNLIVGTNNSGKTSVLEAISLLTAIGDVSLLWSTLWRRGEDFEGRESGRSVRQFDVCRLFHGHDASIGCQFRIAAKTDRGQLSLDVSVAEPPTVGEPPSLFDLHDPSSEPETYFRPNVLTLDWQGPLAVTLTMPITRGGGVLSEPTRTSNKNASHAQRPVRLITAAALSADTIIDLFEEVVLTPNEDTVIEALQIIEPGIERIATSGAERRRRSSVPQSGRGGLLLRCRGVADRIPIGSMGEGIWRLLGLALALVRTEGGILLVDEIDTGLHYTVMEKMWQLVSQTAERLNIQVFATTHSRDCSESLASISRADVSEGSEITIQRIEKGKSRSVAFSEQEIVVAAERHLEVR